ncbi:MAG: hypothetical protein F4100_03650 [Rhodothermaceae bacterium]|nr:hypothetical protein [Rhodothermaceae bacterium]MYE63401.1 hypothetical protein [Rhodothermaceae bacterium]MYJ19832.1 hypothetical protein [Rhodothermaceae bacterium]
MSHVLLDPMKNHAASTPSANARVVLFRAMIRVAIYGLLMPATTLAAQTIVESEDPGRSNLTLAEEPLVRIGVLEGPMEYMFGEITGAIRLEDGSVVVADEQSYEVRMFDASGRHLWTSGQQGEGPGEYGGLRLLRGCPGAAITVFDWHLDRITELDAEGNLIDTRRLSEAGVNPYSEPMCAPDTSLIFTPWPDRTDYASLKVGEIYRWSMSLSRTQGDSVMILRSGIPGTERFFYGGGTGPREWGKVMVFAATDTGVWYGSGDDYELEHVDWSSRVTRIARWTGPDREVTTGHLDRYLNAYLARYDTPAERQRFERERWPDIRNDLPEQFPAFETDGLMALPDGSLWVTTFGWRSPDQELHLLHPSGAWVTRLIVPARSTLLDAGSDWVLLLERGEFGEHSVAVYELVESDDAG